MHGLSRIHVALALLAALLAATPVRAFTLKWEPVDKDLLAETKGKIDPEASSEVVFWEVRLTDSVKNDFMKARFELRQYIRIKIYDDRGRDQESQVQIPYRDGESVEELMARTIRPDGSIVEVKKEAVFDRVITRGQDGTTRAKSFAMPDVPPGCVIEYQYASVRHSQWLFATRFPGQRFSPIRSLTFVLRPIREPEFPYRMRVRAFNGTFPPPEAKTDGSRVIRLENIPAIRNEPDMPPPDQVKPWLYIDYTESGDADADKYWSQEGRRRHGTLQSRMATKGRVRATADSIIAGVTEPEQRLEGLYSFCHNRIRNAADPSAVSQDLRDRLDRDESPTPEETLGHGAGYGTDINLLFASLATAAGFETRVAAVGDRSDMFFQKERLEGSELDHYVVAVRIGDGWRFYDPGSRYAPYGMLPWQREGIPSLLLDAEKPSFVDIPLSPSSSSCRRRSAHLRLGPDGTLEGTVTDTRTGHFGYEEKSDLSDLSNDARLERLRRDILKGWSGVTVDSVRVEGVGGAATSVVISYRIKISGYAAPAGGRLLLPPAVFTHGRPARFPASTRENWIYFHYPWLEEDDIWIDLPDGFAADELDSPSPYRAGRTLRHEIDLESNGKMLHLYRSLEYGSDGAILIPPSKYRELKSWFDTVQQRDDLTLALKRSPSQ